MKRTDNQERYDNAIKKRRIHISRKDAIRLFSNLVRKEGENWIIKIGVVEIRGQTKNSVIVDWCTVNGFEVYDVK